MFFTLLLTCDPSSSNKYTHSMKLSCITKNITKRCTIDTYLHTYIHTYTYIVHMYVDTCIICICILLDKCWGEPEACHHIIVKQSTCILYNTRYISVMWSEWITLNCIINGGHVYPILVSLQPYLNPSSLHLSQLSTTQRDLTCM